jgi:TPR repeat protein
VTHSEIHSLEAAALNGAANVGEIFVQLGLAYATGRAVKADRVAAHKWFNLAAVKGNRDAVRLRRELAEEMTEADIAEAQRAARQWISVH